MAIRTSGGKCCRKSSSPERGEKRGKNFLGLPQKRKRLYLPSRWGKTDRKQIRRGVTSISKGEEKIGPTLCHNDGGESFFGRAAQQKKHGACNGKGKKRENLSS